MTHDTVMIMPPPPLVDPPLGLGREFEEALAYVSRYWLPAKALVAAAVAGRREADPSGRIIVLTQVRRRLRRH